MEQLVEIFTAVFDRFVAVLSFPINPKARIYWLYVLSSVAIAYFVYRAVKARGDHATARDADAAKGSFLGFLFPKAVWSHPSAWLDLRYFFFHKIAEYFLLFGIAASAIAGGYFVTTGGLPFSEAMTKSLKVTTEDWGIAIGFMIFVMIIGDFMGWAIHYMQHKVPLLWQFHKVHHSAEVMHPISNFREHPVDNLTYGFFISLAFGICYGLGVRFFGYVPSAPTLLGVPLLMFFFNLVGYNLRHSHVWLKWPGRWSAVFPSPAHHHVHHSCHPDHIDKNFAFMFPIWDVIFGTYHMPEDNRDVKFGVPEEQGRDLDTVLRLYWVPFRDAYRLFRPKTEMEAPAEPDAEARPTQVPAE